MVNRIGIVGSEGVRGEPVASMEPSSLVPATNCLEGSATKKTNTSMLFFLMQLT